MELWGKGHSPGIDDPELREAVKKYNMMESGFSISTDELPALEVELINMVKAKINEKQMKQQAEAKQSIGGEL